MVQASRRQTHLLACGILVFSQTGALTRQVKELPRKGRIEMQAHREDEATSFIQQSFIVSHKQALQAGPSSGSLRMGALHESVDSEEPVTLLSRVFAVPNQVYNHIAVDATYTSLMGEIFTFPERRPWLFNVMLATFKTWLADLIVQLVSSGTRTSAASQKAKETSSSRPLVDWKRSAFFAAFGFLYVGVVQWIFYVSILTRLFPDAVLFANAPLAAKLQDRQGLMDLIAQVCIDNFVFAMIVYFPVFYVIKEFMQGGDHVGFDDEGIGRTIMKGLGKYWMNFRTDNITQCAVWIPADCIVFAAPMFMRMPLDHGVSFGWTMLISVMRGAAIE